MLTCVRPDRCCKNHFTKRNTAGKYTSRSDKSTVARMNVLLSCVSYPRDTSSANHDGSIHEPLVFGLIEEIRSDTDKLTFSRISMNGMPSKVGNPAPSTVGYRCTTAG